MIVNFTQGSEDWKLWRKSGLGGSDCSKLMGSSYLPFNTVTDLWKDKMNLAPPFRMNDAVLHGMAYEDEARVFFESVEGIKVTPYCFTHDEHAFLKASMDGVTEDLTRGVEIKVPQENAWKSAMKGVIKPYYYSQIQHQMMFTKAEFWDYWVYNVTDGACHFKVARCERYIKEIIDRSSVFWNEYVIPKTCPVSSDFGIDDSKVYDPFQCDGMDYEFLGFRPNLENINLDW